MVGGWWARRAGGREGGRARARPRVRCLWQVVQEVLREVPVETIKEVPVEVIREVEKIVHAPPRRRPGPVPSQERVRVAGGYKVYDGDRGDRGMNMGLWRGYMPRGGRGDYRTSSRIAPAGDD
eukprot:1567853-Prymnesium_polylepis.2